MVRAGGAAGDVSSEAGRTHSAQAAPAPADSRSTAIAAISERRSSLSNAEISHAATKPIAAAKITHSRPLARKTTAIATTSRTTVIQLIQRAGRALRSI